MCSTWSCGLIIIPPARHGINLDRYIVQKLEYIRKRLWVVNSNFPLRCLSSFLSKNTSQGYRTKDFYIFTTGSYERPAEMHHGRPFRTGTGSSRLPPPPASYGRREHESSIGKLTVKYFFLSKINIKNFTWKLTRFSRKDPRSWTLTLINALSEAFLGQMIWGNIAPIVIAVIYLSTNY